jgi:hypothetical protein
MIKLNLKTGNEKNNSGEPYLFNVKGCIMHGDAGYGGSV